MDKAKSIQLLNAAVADELQVIQQYLYWHFHLANQGFGAFSSQLRRIAVQEMGHLEGLANRILSLQGEVEMVAAAPVAKITGPEAILEKAVQMGNDGIAALNKAAVECSADDDSSSKQLFERMVKDKEAHVGQFEKQREHIRQHGPNYSLLDPDFPAATGDRIMKVLLALDSSMYSKSAANAVIAHMKSSHTEVRLLHVHELTPLKLAEELGSPSYPNFEAADQVVQNQVNELMSHTAEKLRAAGFETTVLFETGEAGSVILQHAAAWPADLIVLGSHGRTGLDRILLGSVSEAVARHAHCSVEIVRMPANQ